MTQIYKYDLREFQLRSMVLLETIDQVCKKYGLTYYIIAGTLLGAVRHRGFIPWDDDIDIALSRKDYDLLMAHAEEWVPAPFHIVTHENNKEYPKYFAKLEDQSTTLVERFYLGYVGGIYIDIFPLDEVPNNVLKRKWHFYKFHLLRRLLYYAYRDPYKHGRGLNAAFILLMQRLFKKEWLHTKSQKVLREYKGSADCDYLMTHDDGPRAYRKEIFSTPRNYVFEGRSFCGPAIAEGFLSVLYGTDFMQLPPEERRRSHFHDYCDLEHGYLDPSNVLFQSIG